MTSIVFPSTGIIPFDAQPVILSLFHRTKVTDRTQCRVKGEPLPYVVALRVMAFSHGRKTIGEIGVVEVGVSGYKTS